MENSKGATLFTGFPSSAKPLNFYLFSHLSYGKHSYRVTFLRLKLVVCVTATIYSDSQCYETAIMRSLFPLRDHRDQVLVINHGRVIL